MKKNLLTLCMLLVSAPTLAAEGSRFTYDLGGSSGTYNGTSYTEVNLGLNWYLEDWLNWRNALFSKFGSSINTTYGLDSAVLFETDAYTENRLLGVELFIGPGVRLANEKSNAVFGKAGITFALAGMRIGGGIQQTHYIEGARTDKNDQTLPQDETQYFITLSGGGVL